MRCARHRSALVNALDVAEQALVDAYSRIGRATLSPGTGTTFHDITRTVLAPSGAAYVRVTVYGYISNASTYDWDELVLTAQ